MNPDVRINLERASVLLLDSTAIGMGVLAQIFAGFGARKLHKCWTVDEAKSLLKDSEIDLLVLNDEIAGVPGHEVVRWLRRLEGNVNAFASVILVGGHVRRSAVHLTRDCGANFLMAKPLSPRMVLERVVWVSREKRPFLETDTYVGPDRRFHIPSETENLGRRRGDEMAAIDSTNPLLPLLGSAKA